MQQPSATDALSVLLVEDNAADRETYERHLARDPDHVYALIHAGTIEDGLALAQDLQPDCILLDYHLPDGTGLQFLEKLGTLTEIRPLPVVVTTGNGDEEIAARAIRQGAADYLVKGRVEATRLRLVVHQTVQRVRAENQVRALRRAFVHRVERERRDSEDRWLALSDHLSDAVLLVADGITRYANKAAVRLFGVNGPGDLLGHSLLDRLQPEVRAHVRQLWESGHARETVHRLGDGQTVSHLAIPTVIGGMPAVQLVLRAVRVPEMAPLGGAAE